MIGIIVAALAVYFVVLGRQAISLMTDGNIGLLVMGIAVMVLPLLGVWLIYGTLRTTFDHDRLARRIFEEGRTMDISELPKRPSGRVEREAADELFARYKLEWEADPDSWRTNYQLARAYDVAGDRSRAREIMRRAVALESAERAAR
nr:hypothetical protein [Tomitella biformata]